MKRTLFCLFLLLSSLLSIQSSCAREPEEPGLSEKQTAFASYAQKVSSTTASFLTSDPQWVLGQLHLFDYDSSEQTITLSSPLRTLFRYLIDLQLLDPTVAKISSFTQLDQLLQKSQNEGGLRRPSGLERWQLNDDAIPKGDRLLIHTLLEKLGFMTSLSLSHRVKVDSCLVFGALAQRMEKRILSTLSDIHSGLLSAEKVFLLSSNRPLIPSELTFLQTKIDQLSEPTKSHWQHLLNQPSEATEANAMLFLWNLLAPKEITYQLINSTRLGKNSLRPTGKVTIEDWMADFYREDHPQAIFALAEQPYVRLNDQLRVTILTKDGHANLASLRKRMQNTSFYFASPVVDTPLIMVVLDELAQNIHLTLSTLNYLEHLAP